MKLYKTYIVTKALHTRGICGDVALPYGTAVSAVNGYLCCKQGRICTVTSQNAYDHFVHNDDGRGMERGRLTQDILLKLRMLDSRSEKHARVWGSIWADKICLKYKRPEHADHWVWNYDFYNATIEDLEYIRNLIMEG